MVGSVAVHAIEAIALGFLHELRSDNDISLSRKVITNDEHIWNEILNIFLTPKRRGNRCSV